MPGGSIMAAYNFPPPHHYHHVHLSFESAGTKSFTDLTHIGSRATINIGTLSRLSVLNRLLNNTSEGHKKNAQLIRGLNTTMAAFKLVWEEWVDVLIFFGSKKWANKAQVHADGWVCMKKWKAARYIHSLWRNVAFFRAQKNRTFLFLTRSSYVWHSVHTVCIVANCIVSCPRMEGVCTKLFMLTSVPLTGSPFALLSSPGWAFVFLILVQLSSGCHKCQIGVNLWSVLVKQALQKINIFKHSFSTYYENKLLMCTVHFLVAFDWTLMKDIWYQGGNGDGFVIAVKEKRKTSSRIMIGHSFVVVFLSSWSIVYS